MNAFYTTVRMLLYIECVTDVYNVYVSVIIQKIIRFGPGVLSLLVK